MVDTLGETAVDTIVDAAQGGKITPASVATSLAINAATEGISARAAKGSKACVNTSKPKAGDVPVTKSRKDSTPVQQLALPGPKSNPLALPAPKQPLALPAPEPVLALPEPKQQLALPMPNDIVTIQVSKSKYPESAQHIQDARANGHPSVLTIDRSGAKTNRRQSLKGIDKVPNMDLDEYPPAMFAEGGAGASVRAINVPDNRGSGSSMGHQLRPFDNGTKVFIDIVD